MISKIWMAGVLAAALGLQACHVAEGNSPDLSLEKHLSESGWITKFLPADGESQPLSRWETFLSNKRYKTLLQIVDLRIKQLRPSRVLLIESLHKTDFGEVHSVSFVAETNESLIYFRAFPYPDVTPKIRVTPKDHARLAVFESAMGDVRAFSRGRLVPLDNASREWIGGRYLIWTKGGVESRLASSGYQVSNGNETAVLGPIKALKKIDELFLDSRDYIQ